MISFIFGIWLGGLVGYLVGVFMSAGGDEDL